MANKCYRKKNHHPVLIALTISLILVGLLVSNTSLLSRARTIFSHEVTPTTVDTNADFIKKLLPEAKKLHQTYQVLPSITLAQAILESDWGNSTLSSQYNNLFGVKAGKFNRGVYLNTQEFVNGKFVTVNARFRVYDDWTESLDDHAKLLAFGTDWNANQYQDVINATNYVEAANGLQKDGYATDPSYTQKIIAIVERYHLNVYD